jgi:hypothetical protein
MSIIDRLAFISLLTGWPINSYPGNGNDGVLVVSFFRPQGKRLSIRKVGELKVSLYSSSDYFDARPYLKTLKEQGDNAFIDFIDDHIYSKKNRWLSDILGPAYAIFRSTSPVVQ